MPMVFGVYVHVHNVTVSLTAQTLPTNSTAVSLICTTSNKYVILNVSQKTCELRQNHVKE